MLELNQKVALVARGYQDPVVAIATVTHITPKFARLSTGHKVWRETGFVYGENTISFSTAGESGYRLYRSVPATPELEAKVVQFKADLAKAKKLSNAKSRLSDRIEWMRVGHLDRLSDDQVFAALEALDEIFGGES